MFGLILTGCGADSNQAMAPAPVNQPAPGMVQPAVNTAPVSSVPTPAGSSANSSSPISQAFQEDLDKEDSVVVSINNLGRSNPFKPFRQRSIVSGLNGELPLITTDFTAGLPTPPKLQPSESVSQLMKVKVGGILYDPGNLSSAILNVGGEDYLVHKGDKIFDFYVKSIDSQTVTVKCGNNTYTAQIGEIIDGNGTVNTDPVKSARKPFGGSTRSVTTQDVSFSEPTYTFSVK